MRLRRVLLGVAVILNVAVPQVAWSQMKSPPGGTTPGGAIFDRLHDATTRPVPQAPSPTVPTPEATWVPDRSVQVPGTDGPVFVPGHWERRLSDHELPGHRDPCLRTARHRWVVRPIARAVVPVGRRRRGVRVGGWVVVRREVERRADDEYPVMTPSVEIMATVEAVVPFESVMTLEVPARGMSTESLAATPRGRIAK